MSVRFNGNPNAERDIKRIAVGNLTSKLASVVGAVECPEHHEHPRLVPNGEAWRIEGCCEAVVNRANEG